ncbi:MAG: D-sedoheptulose 7-phosphate isomerase [Solirubrobacteraceae bacterium]|jgi:D-sedoheptulose 7-phosphate isomerase|nr:D-sedoheptulose 7-phosphate isomerase [Solirubrobacteraceae bacterium]
MKSAPAVAAGERFFTVEAERIARLCHAMSDRFARGGRLIAVGCSPQARSDARHVAVEFVHPVIVGKRALPALAVTHEPQQLELLAEPDDMVMAFDDSCGWMSSDSKPVYLSIGYGGSGAEWDFDPGCDDPFVAQELVETHYHLLWELVHVFFEHRGRQGGAAQDGGAAAWLYPMLGERARDPEAVVRDVAASVLMKSEEISALRTQTIEENEDGLNAAAAAMRASFAKGGRLLSFGNGGSCTDAMDAVADTSFPPKDLTPHPALDLSDDASILTAIANDIGVGAIFSRQVIAHARAQDVVLSFSTSGNSENVIEALAEARRRGVVTVAMVGYDGGKIADQKLADHVIVTRSQHIPRIQEAQASAWHALRELVG